MKRPLVWSPAFTRLTRRLLKRHPEIRASLQATLTLLEADAFDPRLHTHKLKGDLSDFLACSAGYDLRILFQLAEYNKVDSILLHSIGTHDDVY